jgi:nucleotide-binding universal stress UspA family protein
MGREKLGEVRMYQHILISTDGSEIAQKGVDHGLALAKALGAKVTIIMVSESLFKFVGGESGLSATAYLEYTEYQRDAAVKVLASGSEAAERAGIEADTVLLENNLPAEAIVQTAKARNCDLIAMSSHGRRGLSRLILGSVTSEVLANSPVPVLVVR